MARSHLSGRPDASQQSPAADIPTPPVARQVAASEAVGSSTSADDRWWRIDDDACPYDGLSRWTHWRAIKAGKLRAVRVGGRYRTRKNWVDEWLASLEVGR